MALALLDTNVLVNAVYRQSDLFNTAAALVDRGLREAGVYCIAPQNLVEFAAVVTRPRLVSVPLRTAELVRIVDLLYRSRRLAKIYPQRGTVMRAIRNGSMLGVSGPRWYDLFLASTMQDAGVRMIITDNTSDFRAFPFLTTIDIRDAV